MMVRACSPSCPGACGRRVTGVQEFVVSLYNIARVYLKKKNDLGSVAQVEEGKVETLFNSP